MSKLEEIALHDGKYRFWMDGVILRCARYEERYWREFIGDNAVLALFRECIELRKQNPPGIRS